MLSSMGVGLKDMVRELQERVQKTTVQEVKAALDRGDVDFVIDVRDAGEYRKGHLPGARNVSRGMLELKLDPSAPMPDQDVAGKWDASIVVYCLQAPGFRSLAAADTLARMGYTKVRQLAGGLEGWAGEGLQIVTERTREA
jgi:rhodanese-related sulfurtransferase